MIQGEPKFEINDTVKVVNSVEKGKLKISSCFWKTQDDLHTMLNLDFEPQYYYCFNGSNLCAPEKDIIKA